MEEAARVLRARTHYDVLGLAVPTEVAPRAEVRRRYKELAVRLHPDKNRAPGAEDAFKRLSQAYECLADHQTQNEYLAQLHGRDERRQPLQRTRPSKTRAVAKKPPPPPPPSDTPASSSAHRTRWRTPEEVWRRFQREEEEQARREFFEKGFDRAYAKNASKRRRVARYDGEEGETFSQPLVPGPNTGNDPWAMRNWEKPPSSAAGVGASGSQEKLETHLEHCCLLCRRKFPSAVSLRRHEDLSALHHQNLRKVTHTSS